MTRAIRDYWQGYGYDHLPGCAAVPRCTCGYVETMRAYFALRIVEEPE